MRKILSAYLVNLQLALDDSFTGTLESLIDGSKELLADASYAKPENPTIPPGWGPYYNLYERHWFHIIATLNSHKSVALRPNRLDHGAVFKKHYTANRSVYY